MLRVGWSSDVAEGVLGNVFAFWLLVAAGVLILQSMFSGKDVEEIFVDIVHLRTCFSRWWLFNYRGLRLLLLGNTIILHCYG